MIGSLNEHEIPVMSVIIENSFHLFITGVNSVLKSLKLEQGDIILCTDNSYNAVKKTCEAIAQVTSQKGNALKKTCQNIAHFTPQKGNTLL